MNVKNIFIYIQWFCVFCMNGIETQVVNTSSGTVEGLTLQILNQTIEQYLGIPYAVPPVGSLRFGKPIPIAKPIEGIIDATKPWYSCLQPILPDVGPMEGIGETDEDCLVLNIWTQQQNSTAHKLKPVMFWIHGGALFFGSIFQEHYNGSVLATHDVVFVSANYRLGLFGFLYGDDDSAPGNAGFYDQNLALHWVRDNIHLFGGDRNQITIMGQSAGSWSVGSHLVSPLSKGLFKRAVMMSGAHMFNKNRPVVSKEEALMNAKNLAQLFFCEDNDQWLQCLRDQSPSDLRWYSYDIVFPVVDTEFLPLMTRTALEQGQFNKDINLLAGFTKNDGTIVIYLFEKLYLLVSNYYKYHLDNLLDKVDEIFHDIDKERIENFYLDNIDINNSTAIKKMILKMTTDFSMKCPTYSFAKLYAQHSTPETSVFFYELTHKTYGFLSELQNSYLYKYLFKFGPFNKFTNEVGIYHSSDIPLLFGRPFLRPNTVSSEDLNFTEKFMKLFTDFAKFGKPDPNWPKLEGSSLDYVKNLNPDPFDNDNSYDSVNVCNTFWKDYF